MSSQYFAKPIFIVLLLLNSIRTFAEPANVEIIQDSTNGAESEIIENKSHIEIDKFPEQIHFEKAEYPNDIVAQGISGIVLLELLINENGFVDSARVINGIHPVLDSNAITASKKFKFSPAISGNGTIAVVIQYEYRFSIEEKMDSLKQFINFQGQFIEKGTRNPIVDAMVVVKFPDTLNQSFIYPLKPYLKKIGTYQGQYIEDNNLITKTDSTGKFSFYSLPQCSIEVQLIAYGYERYKSIEKISKGEIVETKCFVKKLNYNEYEIVVYGSVEEKEVSRHQLSVEEIQKIPGLSGDAIKVVQTMPGVARPSFGFGDVIVRGTPSWDSKYFLDGISIPMLYHFGGLKSVYNSDALKSVDFYPGGFGTKYGNVTGGIVEIQGKKALDDRMHLKLDLSSLDGSVLAEGPLNTKVSVLASARRSFIGDIIHLYTKMNKDQLLLTASPFYWDYLLRTDVKVSKKNKLFVTLFGSRDSLAVISSAMAGGSEEISSATDKIGHNETFHMVIAGWDTDISNRMANSLRAAFTYHRAKMNILGYLEASKKAYITTIRDQLCVKLTEKTKINAGLDIELKDLNLILVMLDQADVIVRDTTKNWLFGNVGIYTNFEIKPFSQLQIIPGIRFDHMPELNYDRSIAPEFWDYKKYDDIKSMPFEPSFRLSARLNFTNNQTLKASIGNYNQTPQPMEMVTHKLWGEENMPATKAVHYVLGHEWQMSERINSDLQFYFNRQWNIPEEVKKPANTTEESNKWSKNGLGRMMGMEMMLRHLKNERFFGWIVYSLSRAERYNYNDKKWELFGNDQTHNLQLLGSIHLKKEYDLGARMRFTSGNPTTPIIGVMENATNKINKTPFEPIYGVKNSKRMKPFFQMDIRLDKKFVFDKWMHSFYVDFTNISWFIYKSPEIESYNYDYSEKTIITLPPMIAIGCKSEF